MKRIDLTGGMRSSLNDVMMRDQNMMSGMDERDMMYNNMLGYRVNTYQDGIQHSNPTFQCMMDVKLSI